MVRVLRALPCTVPLLVALSLGGCAQIPPDRGLPVAAGLAVAHGVPAGALAPPDTVDDAQLAAWLRAPLTVETAQRIALSHNPRLRQQYAALGIAQAEVYDAARISNPMVSLEWLDSNGRAAQVTVGLAQNFADVLRLTPRKRLASGELARAQQAAAADLVKLAGEVEVAYYQYVGVMAVRDLREAIAEAAQVSAALAQRLRDAGNISVLDLAREQAAAASARIDADRALGDVAAARAALNTAMGLEAEGEQWTIEAQLALPVATEDGLEALLALAAGSRLDLRAARQAVTTLEDARGIARTYRLLGDLEVGASHERDPDGTRLTGPSLSIELPVFNWGHGRVLRADAELEQARAAARELEIEIANDVRAASARVASTRRVVEGYRTALIPQREAALQAMRGLQNFMLVGQFDLLLAKQAQYEAYQGYLEALTQYATARAGLALAVGTRLPSSADYGAATVDPRAVVAAPPPAAADAPHQHSAGSHGGHVHPAPAEGGHDHAP